MKKKCECNFVPILYGIDASVGDVPQGKEILSMPNKKRDQRCQTQ